MEQRRRHEAAKPPTGKRLQDLAAELVPIRLPMKVPRKPIDYLLRITAKPFYRKAAGYHGLKRPHRDCRRASSRHGVSQNSKQRLSRRQVPGPPCGSWLELAQQDQAYRQGDTSGDAAKLLHWNPGLAGAPKGAHLERPRIGIHHAVLVKDGEFI